MIEVDKTVKRYIDHFRSEHEKIRILDDDLHRELLTVAMLSALAEGRYPKISSDRNKFVRLIEDNSDWLYAKSVSIVQLEMLVSRKQEGLSQNLIERVSMISQEWRKRNRPNYRTVELSADPNSNQLLSVATTDRDRSYIGQVKHSSLLYTYRCKLVHEFRNPGYGLKVFQDHSPYYHSRINLDDGTKSIELVYPGTWFIGLVTPILDHLERYYVDARVDPYESYRFGSSWAD